MDWILPVVLLPVIGIIAGVVLGLANHFMAVKENEKVKALREALPGANCGGCGFSGCNQYAEALAESPNLRTNLCPVGGDAVAARISEILGVAASKTEPKCAVVRCVGSKDVAHTVADYEGIDSCLAASMLYNGGKGCRFGCLGYGDCAGVCDTGALSVRNGVAVVEPSLCVACGKCVKACPKQLIALVKAGERPYVPCRNTDKGADTKRVCSVGCLGCRMCAKACPADAISFEGGCAVIDPEKCTACGACVAACKFGVIKIPR